MNSDNSKAISDIVDDAIDKQLKKEGVEIKTTNDISPYCLGVRGYDIMKVLSNAVFDIY